MTNILHFEVLSLSCQCISRYTSLSSIWTTGLSVRGTGLPVRHQNARKTHWRVTGLPVEAIGIPVGVRYILFCLVGIILALRSPSFCFKTLEGLHQGSFLDFSFPLSLTLSLFLSLTILLSSLPLFSSLLQISSPILLLLFSSFSILIYMLQEFQVYHSSKDLCKVWLGAKARARVFSSFLHLSP